MSLRGRITLMSAGAVGVTVLLASIVCYLVMRGELRGQVDDALRAQGALIEQPRGPAFDERGPGPGRFPGRLPEPPFRLGGPAGFAQFVTAGGRVVRRGEGGVAIPVRDGDVAVAGGRRDAFLSDRHAGGLHIRVLTVPIPGVGAVQLARSLENADATLRRLRLVLAVLCVAGTGFAAAMGRLFSRPVIAPIADLTDTAEHIETTGDLGRRLSAAGSDEVGRMAGRFNAMLDRLQTSQAALGASLAAQRQLVADASHELRTPVTSLRTNAEVLRDGERLDDVSRRALADDLIRGTEELSELVGDLIDLARGDVPEAPVEDVRLDEVVRESVERAARHAPHVSFRTDLRPTVVDGVPDRLARAVGNLLHNAAKYSPAGEEVEVRLADDGELVVRDRGPGVSPDELAHVFDRFYRGSGARERAGSGLGLAIVKQVADAHGGAVSLEPAAGGGTIARLRLPATPEGLPEAVSEAATQR